MAGLNPRVLIDATRLDRRRRGGMDRCIGGLVNALAGLPGDERPALGVIVSRVTTLDVARLRHQGLIVVQVGGRNRVLREQMIAPLAARRAGSFDIWHAPGYAPPRHVTAKSLMITVQDLHFALEPSSMAWTHRLYWARWFLSAVDRADSVVTPTQATAADVKRLTRAGVAGVIPWGLDAPPESPGPPPGGLERGRYFLFVGPVEPRKNLRLALEAHARLPRARWPLVVLGRLRRPSAAERAGLSANGVVHMEPVSESTYWGLLAGAGALLYPSRYEGFGLPPLEAMSQSVPALVSEIPTARELYGGAARLLPAVAEHWAEAMADVMRGDIPDAALGREVAARYDWSNCARAYVRRYAALA